MTSNNCFTFINFAREQKRTDPGETVKLSPKVLMWRKEFYTEIQKKKQP